MLTFWWVSRIVNTEARETRSQSRSETEIRKSETRSTFTVAKFALQPIGKVHSDLFQQLPIAGNTKSVRVFSRTGKFQNMSSVKTALRKVQLTRNYSALLNCSEEQCNYLVVYNSASLHAYSFMFECEWEMVYVNNQQTRTRTTDPVSICAI